MPSVLPTTTLRSLTLSAEILPGTAFLAAGSGLVIIGDHLVVAADDAVHLGVFAGGSDAPGSLFRLRDEPLSADPVARKRQKPDFEVLTSLPPSRPFPTGALLAMGSGSTPNRQTAVIIPITSAGALEHEVHHRDLRALYDLLRDRCGEVNVEGAFVQDGDLVVISRGNGSAPDNHVARYRLAAITRWLGGNDREVVSPTSVVPMRLDAIDGVPLGVTDAAAHPDGGWVFSAVAEDTADSYNDGALTEAVIGRVAGDGSLETVARLSPTAKVEGIVASRAVGHTRLTMVTDADDPTTPASLLIAYLPD